MMLFLSIGRGRQRRDPACVGLLILTYLIVINPLSAD
jgi:hypothetical protein